MMTLSPTMEIVDRLVDRMIFPGRSTYTSEMVDELVWIPGTLSFQTATEETSIPCALFTKQSARFLILYFHGNGEDLYRCRTFCRDMSSTFDQHVLAMEYPGYGIASHAKPSEDLVLRYAEAVVRFLTEIVRWSADKIILMGRSIGTGPALHIASRYDVHGCILIAPFVSIKEIVRERFGFISRLINERFNNLENIKNCVCPFLIVHGQSDGMYGVQHSEQLYSACPSRKLLVLPEKMTHNADLFEDSFYFAAHAGKLFPLPDYSWEALRLPQQCYEVTWASSKLHRMHAVESELSTVGSSSFLSGFKRKNQLYNRTIGVPRLNLGILRRLRHRNSQQHEHWRSACYLASPYENDDDASSGVPSVMIEAAATLSTFRSGESTPCSYAIAKRRSGNCIIGPLIVYTQIHHPKQPSLSAPSSPLDSRLTSTKTTRRESLQVSDDEAILSESDDPFSNLDTLLLPSSSQPGRKIPLIAELETIVENRREEEQEQYSDILNSDAGSNAYSQSSSSDKDADPFIENNQDSLRQQVLYANYSQQEGQQLYDIIGLSPIIPIDCRIIKTENCFSLPPPYKANPDRTYNILRDREYRPKNGKERGYNNDAQNCYYNKHQHPPLLNYIPPLVKMGRHPFASRPSPNGSELEYNHSAVDVAISEMLGLERICV